jgi:hypothetical protein
MTVTGDVRDVRSHWTEDGSRIVTEATVHTTSGDVVVRQLGGSVDGIGMISFPGPEPLVEGMRATVAVTPSMDLSNNLHNVVDAVKVLAYPAGYVRTGPTKAGSFLFWESGCVFVTPDSAGTKAIPGDQEFAVIQKAVDTWNNGVASCSYIQLMLDAPRPVETGRDNVNVIKFRDQSWCRPATKDDPAHCHPDSAAGITTATYVDDASSIRDGAIVDADIELNGVDFAISVDGESLSQGCHSDLQNTLTHELGHLLGLEHTCRTNVDPPRIDDMGNAVPSCSTVMGNPVYTEPTMYNFQECGETKKSSLEQDDIDGVCGIYPKDRDPGTCDRVENLGGCCDAGSHPEGSLLLALATLGLARFWRRRR